MKRRCINSKRQYYKYYGGRGIAVCDRWLSFEKFIQDMGERPYGFTLDRINNDGNYEPGNCRWATSKEQSINKKNNRFYNLGGLVLTLSQWAEQRNILTSTLRERLLRGWSIQDALTIPVRKGKYNEHKRIPR